MLPTGAPIKVMSPTRSTMVPPTECEPTMTDERRVENNL